MLADNTDLARQLEEAESRASQVCRSKTLIVTQHEDIKKQMDEELKVGPGSGVGVCVLRVCVCGGRRSVFCTPDYKVNVVSCINN